jgi:hypothetical protein
MPGLLPYKGRNPLIKVGLIRNVGDHTDGKINPGMQRVATAVDMCIAYKQRRWCLSFSGQHLEDAYEKLTG